MFDLRAEVKRTIEERRLFAPGERVLVGVSGGMDSMVLLHVLAELGEWKLCVAHLNHGLRGKASDADERLVGATAKKLGLRFVSERGDVKGYAKAHGVSLEMAARALRHEFFVTVAKRLSCRKVALAHHANDQVELFFLRLLRGTGLEALAGMKWMSPSPADSAVTLVRPFLALTRAQIEDYAQAKKIPSRHDATNDQIDILRNRIRHELLPLIEKRYQPAIRQVVLRLMDIAAREADVVAQVMARREPCPTKRFEKRPVAIQRRLLQQELAQLGILADYDAIERLRQQPGMPICLNNDLMVVRDREGRVRRHKCEVAAFNGDAKTVNLKTGGRTKFDDVKIAWSIQQLGKAKRRMNAKRRECRELFDADKIGRKIVLRHWQPGDRFQPIGMTGSTKLQDFFANQKVPRAQRHSLIVGANAAGEIFWVEGMRISERFKLDAGTKRRLEWSWRRGPGRLRRGSKDANLQRKSR